MLHTFLAGAGYLPRALGLIGRNRQLWGFVLLPIGLNIGLGLALYAGLYTWGAGLIADRLAVEGALGGALLWLLQVLLSLALLLSLGWLLVRFGVVLGAPWYGQLSERVEILATGRAAPAAPLTVRGALSDIGRALQFELKKLLLLLLIGLPALLLNLIPVAGQLMATTVGVGLGVTIACLDFFDGPQERRRRRFRQKLGMVRGLMPASLGFGLLAFFLVSIPLVNLLAIPLCVTAGTLLVVERGLDRKAPDDGRGGAGVGGSVEI